MFSFQTNHSTGNWETSDDEDSELKELDDFGDFEFIDSFSSSGSFSPRSNTPCLSTSPLRFSSDFVRVRHLAKGGFGIVDLVKNKLDGGQYAIKKIKLEDDREVNRKILREVTALRRLSHPNIIRYYNSWVEAGFINHNCENGEVFDSDSEDEDLASIALSCSQCCSNYMPWEIAEFDFNDFSLGSVESNESLCESCYKGQLEDLGMNPEELQIRKKTQIPQYLFIQMEYCSKTLAEALLGGIQFWEENTPSQIWEIFRQIVEAVAYVHSQYTIHRDLKPSNIFITKEGLIKLGDFGLVKGKLTARRQQSYANLDVSFSPQDNYPSNRRRTSIHSQTKQPAYEIGSVLYCAPEMNSKICNEKIDSYSLGIVLFELWHPCKTNMERVTLIQKLREKANLPEEFNANFPIQSNLILKLTTTDPRKRPSPKELLTKIPQVNKVDISAENLKLKQEVHSLKDGIKILQSTISDLENLTKEQQTEIERLLKMLPTE